MRFLFLILVLLGAASAMALDFDGTWKEQDLPLKSSNQYGLNGGSLAIASDGAVSILYRPVYQAVRGARWNWSIESSVPVTNLRSKGGDDRNISLYFVFAPEAVASDLQGQSLSKVLRNKNVRALIYTYGGQDGRGAAYQSPYLQGRGLVIVKAGAGVGSGSEDVDLVADFGRAYGAAPEILIGVGVSADSDDTKGSIRATLSGLVLR